MKNHNVLAEEIDALKKQLAVVNAEYKKMGECRKELRDKIADKRGAMTRHKIDAMDKNSDQYWSLMAKRTNNKVIHDEQVAFFKKNGTGNNWKVRANGFGDFQLGYDHTSSNDAHECATFLNRLLCYTKHNEDGYFETRIIINCGNMYVKVDGSVIVFNYSSAQEQVFQSMQAAFESGVVK